jgi:hypothetical protein
VIRVAALLTSLLLPSVALAERPPSLPKGAPYGKARQALVGAGWQPVVSPGADKCDRGDRRCQGRPEMQTCAGTGLARCFFLWRKGARVIEIGTIGDEEALVDRVRCRSGCS